ncbi:MAG: AMP-binding protein [bacterium]|nr:AMP-binding protein [bacterium]
MIHGLARSHPEGLALFDGTRRRGWAELLDRTTRWARLLRSELGLAPDDHAALLIGSRVEGIEGILAAIHAGVWMTPVNWHLTPNEIAYVVEDSEAKVIFTDPEHEAVARASGAQQVIVAGEELEALLAGASDEPMPLDGPAGGNMIYTSGTTGRPKGVMRRRASSLGNALAGQEAYARSIGCDGSGPHLVTGPLYHAAPLMFAIYDQACGAPVRLLPRWEEREALRVLRDEEIHHTHLVPTMFVRLLRMPEEERAEFHAPSLHTVLHGAAPVSVAVKKRMLDWWGPILLEYWGGTEGGVTTLVDAEAWTARPGTVGQALPQYEVFAVSAAGERLGPNEEGDLYARHATTEWFFEYHGDPQKTAQAFLDPLTHTLGDIGRVDAEGWVYLSDRRSNLIISGGVNIYPVEIEQILQEHPAVADVGVFGIPDEEWGEQVKAAVELTPGYEPSSELAEALRSYAREQLAGYKVPRTITFERELPRTDAGKLYRRRLQ